MSTTGQNARAGRIAPQKDGGRIVPSVKYFTQNSMNGAYKRLGQLHMCLPDRREISEEHRHEDSDYRTGLDRDPRNVRDRENPATQGGSRPTQQLREP
jgi:hypothetical protein